MSVSLKTALWVQQTAQRFGVVMKRSNYNSREDLRLLRFLELNRIDTVLDVGGNRGEYAAQLIEGGFKGRIISFEALPDMHARLVERSAPFAKQWTIAPRCAISDREGEAEFHVTKGVSSSSLLPPAQTTSDMPGIYTVQEKIRVRTRTLADCCAELGVASNRIFLKLDIQGGEEMALKGAESLLPRIAGLVAEMPLRTYYEGQAMARTLDAWITARGYELWDIQTAWRHPDSGRLEHIDATYFRDESA